ncbi:MAG: site-specific integrase [Planctomycetota bacterium]
MTKKSTPRVPKYRCKNGKYAFVEIGGVRRHLGKWNSPESREMYHRVVSEWEAGGRRSVMPGHAPAADITMVELIAAYWAHAQSYYVDADGQPTSAIPDIKAALKPVRELYGRMAVAEFGPVALKTVRERYIASGWNRATCNSRVGIVVRMLKFGVENEMVPESVAGACVMVKSLAKGRSKAPEPGKVRPVADAMVDAIEPFASRQVWAMIQVQRYSGARGGEIVRMRAIDLDMSDDVWTYTPERHKNTHRDHTREIYIPPVAQPFIRQFMPGRALDAYLFSPAEAEAERRAANHAERVTPMSCGNKPGRGKRNAKRRPRDRYDPCVYAGCIQRACDKAFPPPPELQRIRVPGPRAGGRWETRAETAARIGAEGRAKLKAWRDEHRWHPHQLRHSAATFLRKEFGIEIARLVLEHATASVTELYAETSNANAKRAMREWSDRLQSA